MWIKLMAPALTSMVGLSLAAISPQDGPAKAKGTVTFRTEVKTGDSSDSPDELADVYDRLVKVRYRRLSDRPKKLADEAAALYRQAVAAAEKGETDKAQGLTKAASELTRALEISLKTSPEQASDPELPPPPRRAGRKAFLYYYGKTESGEEIPPELPAKVKTQDEEKFTIRTKNLTVSVPENQAKIEADGDVRVRLYTPSGGERTRDVIVERRADSENPHEVQVRSIVDGTKGHGVVAQELNEIIVSANQKVQAESERSRAQAARAAATAAHADAIKNLNFRINLLNEQNKAVVDQIEVKLSDETLDKLKKTESLAKLHEALAGIQGKNAKQQMQIQILERDSLAQDNAATAIAKLKGAHDLLLKLRESKKGEEGSNHLDAARDLYNSARREAEAKHFDRAAELAKAAESLAGVDKMLHEIRVEARIVDKEGNVKVLRDLLKSQNGAEGPLVMIDKAEKAKGATKEFRVESDSAGPVQGIGVQLSFDGGKGQVQDLIVGGPAAKDGRIKAGDSLVGIETAAGATIGFGDKTLVEVTKLLRGPVGSKVKVIVQPKGSNDRKVYEIERQTLSVPKPDTREKPEGEGGDGALPPVLD